MGLRSLLRGPYHSFVVRFVRPHVERSLETWFYDCLVTHETYARGWSAPPGVYYEFGVAGGYSMSLYVRALRAFCRRFGRSLDEFDIYGFDSFQGLPPKASERDDHREWDTGTFSFSEAHVRAVMRRERFPLHRLHLVKGFYEETLTPALRDQLAARPPAIVTIDCDYYSSTMTVLEWLRPFLVSGTCFYFDDVWSFHGNPDYGELAAIRDFNARGDGTLTPYSLHGIDSYSYIYSRRVFEFGSERPRS